MTQSTFEYFVKRPTVMKSFLYLKNADSQSDLAKRCDIHPQMAKNALEVFEEYGLVTRMQFGRRYNYNLTEKGRKAQNGLLTFVSHLTLWT